MKDKRGVGARIIEGLQQAIAYERGQLEHARVRHIPITARSVTARPAPRYSGRRIAAVRTRLKLSQPVFAGALNVSPETVRAWEQSKRRPDGAALRLLEIAERHPEIILEHVKRRTA